MKAFLIVLLLAVWIGSFFISPAIGAGIAFLAFWCWFCWNFPVLGFFLSMLNLFE